MSGFVVAVAILVAIFAIIETGPEAHEVAATGEPGTVTLERIGQFREPLHMAQPPGDDRHLFVVEKKGRVRLIEGDQVLERPFLDIRNQVGSAGTEQGLLSIAFAPDYASSGRFFVNFTNTVGNTRVVEYRRSESDPDLADPGSRRVYLRIRQPDVTHNGGSMLFGPDGNLYIGSGDGGLVGDPQGNGLSRRTLLGKILRIEPRPNDRGRPYAIPDGNPFLGGQHGFRPEIFAYGLRNPWRFSFDRETDAMLIGDVGQDNWEEVDYLAPGEGAGANFGWSAFEAFTRFKPGERRGRKSVKPILAYRHRPACSVTAGYVVRDPDLPSLFGRFIYGDYCTGVIRTFIPSPKRAIDDRRLGVKVPALSSFAEDNAGHIYAISLSGDVYRLRTR
jgi:glucose/arabinose dehydrogenase